MLWLVGQVQPGPCLPIPQVSWGYAKGKCLPLPHLIAVRVFLWALTALYLAAGSLGSSTNLEGQGEECWPLVQILDSVHLEA